MSNLTFVVRQRNDGTGWIIRSQGLLGEGAVGPRLAKGGEYPEFGQVFKTREEAKKVANNWSDWYNGQAYLKKKRKAKYLA